MTDTVFLGIARISKVFIVLIPMLFAIGCAPSETINRRMLSVSPGQTKEYVISQIGAPENRQFSGRSEAWQYCTTGMSSDDHVIVWFTDGIVTGMTTYQSRAVGICSNGFNAINWEDRPDYTLEVRNR